MTSWTPHSARPSPLSLPCCSPAPQGTELASQQVTLSFLLSLLGCFVQRELGFLHLLTFQGLPSRHPSHLSLPPPVLPAQLPLLCKQSSCPPPLSVTARFPLHAFLVP